MDDPNLPIPQSTSTPPGIGDVPAPDPAEAPSPPNAPELPDSTAGPNEPPGTDAGQPVETAPVEASTPAVGPGEEGSGEPAQATAAEPPAQEPPDAAGAEVAQVAPATPTEAPEPETPAKASRQEPPPPEPVAETPAPKSEKMDWYILKVQSNREESIREGLRRRVSIAGLDSFFGDIIIPTEKVTEFKAGKRKVLKRKLYPGYLVVQMEINEDTWFLVRETPGIGDFTGAAGHPTPMQDREVAAILAKQEEKTDEAPKLKINFRVGDHVKIKEGTFENFEGDVANIDETNGRVTVLINIFGRSTPVDIEYWQIEAV
jgi:transcriptional antiterminator NusG